jgi:antitoxin (DNA-binding transcriptional repressor) of toxin-antitoxin stability system
MSSRDVGIEDARKVLGDLATEAAQGTDIILTRNRRPVARISRYQEDPVITVAELATTVGLPSSPDGAERFARFAGAYRVASDYTKVGQIPPRWAGQGTNALFTRDEADTLLADWDRTATAVGPDGVGAVMPYRGYPSDPNYDPQEVADRYWS